MSDIQKIIQLNPVISGNKNRIANGNNNQNNKGSINFADTVKDFINAVNTKQKMAAGNVSDVIQGKSENLAETMTSLEEARVSFQLMLEIRNKLLESYQEIQRMQV